MVMVTPLTNQYTGKIPTYLFFCKYDLITGYNSEIFIIILNLSELILFKN